MHFHFDLVMQRALAEANAQSASSRLAIAYSGGLDSAVLLHLCAAYAKQHSISLYAFHVHHGISSNADHWVAHCRQQCNLLKVPFEAVYIQLEEVCDHGVEAAARKKRYAALGELCRQHQIDVLLTAHHQDDQAETMLLHLLRGTGVAGLCGMQQCQNAVGLLNDPKIRLVRPLLGFTRSELEKHAQQQGISYIEDESNTDVRYKRNALRHQIMPLLAQYFPGYQTRFARTAQHAQSALDLLEQLAKQDYEEMHSEDGKLNLVPLLQLPEARVDNVLRYWLMQHQVKMPDTARLAEIRKQLLHARDDAQVCVKHGSITLHRYRQQLSIAKNAQPAGEVQDFVWRGEASLIFPTFHGTLFFDPPPLDQPGIHRTWLLQQTLQLRPRQGGERLKLAPNRPNRSIKNHYQTYGIPYWERARLPLVFVGEQLLFAAGVGIHGDFQKMGEDCVILRWEKIQANNLRPN